MASLVLAVGCASPETPPTGGGGGGGDLAGSSSDGAGGSRDLAGPDGSLFCGDGVCTPSLEDCTSCPADCGACNKSCPMGFGDCDGNPQNGCETNLNTVDNCGACGKKCQAQGGTNRCILVGASYVCMVTCDATHADCNKDPSDGCEVDLTTAQACGSCTAKCSNPNGTTACTTQGAGWFCSPTCANGYAACGQPEGGCTTQVGSDADHCGGCNRPCAAAQVATRACANGLCTPSCSPGWADCSRPAAPAADDGCETNPSRDPGEPDNTCNGQPLTVEEGATAAPSTNRILPSGDTDTFAAYLHEGSHVCFPGTSQSYQAKVYVNASDGTPLQFGYNLNGCDNTWTTVSNGSALCISWGGTCSADDSQHFYFQVQGVGGASSCSNYTLSVQYCSEGQKCPGCP